IVGVFVIFQFLMWWRLSLRWYSILQVMIRRMEHIERQSSIRSNLYVAYLNGREGMNFGAMWENQSINQPSLRKELIDDLNKIKSDYEHRGIKPIINLFVGINIFGWSIIIIVSMINFFVEIYSSKHFFEFVTILVFVIISAIFLVISASLQ